MRHKLFALLLLLSLSAAGLSAQAAAPLQPIVLWPGGAPGAVGHQPQDIPTVTPYLAPPAIATGAAFVIYPGGGYRGLSRSEESPIAHWFNQMGISAFVVHYRYGPRYHYPAPIADGERALRLVRASDRQWSVNPGKIGIIGFSAGGQLAATVGTHFDDGNPQAADPIDRVSDRPDLMMLVYALIDIGRDVPGGSSKPMLLGDHPSPTLLQLLTNENYVTARTPATFIAQCVDDPWVNVANAFVFAEALKKTGVPFELHLFQHGPHGFGLADGNGTPNNPYLAIWTKLATDWLQLHGWAR